MKYQAVASAAPHQQQAPLLAVGVPKVADKKLPVELAGFDALSGGNLKRLFESGDFGGGRDEAASLYLKAGGGGPDRLLLVGLGKPETVNHNAIRRAASIAARRSRGFGTGSVEFWMPAQWRAGVAVRHYAQVAVEGMGQGAWFFDELKLPNEDKKTPVSQIGVWGGPAEKADLEEGVRVGAAVAEGQALTRRLQFLPPNTCTPEFLAETARDIAKRLGLVVTTLDKAAIEREGMGMLLAVAQGSKTEPRFMILQYQGAGAAAPLALVGKGITFDTGGISIKPAASMDEMKYDMSGAAAVLGAMEAIGRIKPKVNVVGVVPSCDNMPGGGAFRPADVVKSHFGKHVEIVNTDAEGRLILGDALSFVRRFKPAAVLDAATLTGAAIFVTGHQASPIMGNDEGLIEEVKRAAERAGERVWPLPMYDEFRDQNKSDIADVKNSGGRPAGTITAGWFLREFVEGYPWVHLDVAGTAYTEADSPPLPKGPAGVPMRLFVEWVLSRAG